MFVASLDSNQVVAPTQTFTYYTVPAGHYAVVYITRAVFTGADGASFFSVRGFSIGQLSADASTPQLVLNVNAGDSIRFFNSSTLANGTTSLRGHVQVFKLP